MLGIDFGTCNSSASLMMGGTLRMVKDPNKHGFSLPSSVYLHEDGEMRVGHLADNSRRKDPTRYRREFKRDWGKTEPYMLGNRNLLPEELATAVIGKLKTEAWEMVKGREDSDLAAAVITVPATYQTYKQELMKKAGLAAGFTQVILLPEPVAAAVYYAKNYSFAEGETILVYDLGGGTFDATLIQKQEDGYRILAAPVGLAHCGGIDFDRQIFQDLTKRCSSTLRDLLNPRNRATEAWLARLVVADFCRDFKHQLSEEVEHEDWVLAPGAPPERYYLSRDAFNSMVAPSIAETIQLCHQLVKRAGIEWEKVDRVLLVGGSCRIPYVKAAVERELKRPVLRVDEPELAVSQGAGVFSDRQHAISNPTPEPTPEPKPEPPKTSQGKRTVYDPDPKKMWDW